MAIALQSSNQLAQVHGVKILTYARSGMGKTVLCSTAPNPVIISAEAGLLSLKRQNLERLFGFGNPSITYDMPVIQVNTIEQLIEAELWARTSNEARQFQTVCVDSISEIAEVVLAKAKKDAKDPRQAYGVLLDKIIMVIKAFRDLPGKHVLMLAKEEQIKDGDTGVILRGPAMPGAKAGPAAPYLFDEVFNLNKAKDAQSGMEYRYLRTQPDLKYDAKDRSGALAVIEQPHIGYIIDKILRDGNNPAQNQ